MWQIGAQTLSFLLAHANILTLSFSFHVFSFFPFSVGHNLFAITFIGAADPTFLKEPTDKVVFGVMSGLCIFGCANIMTGLYSMSYGVNKL